MSNTKHILLKFVPTVNRYTTAKVEDRKYIQSINRFPAESPHHKLEHGNMYITYERLIELQSIALTKGYLFTY